MKVVSFITAKGGCGKSSLNLELAATCGKLINPEKVLVLDLDQQCSLSMNCNADLEGKNILDVLTGECSFDEAIQHNELFDIIPATSQLANADKLFKDDEDDEYLLSDLLNMVQDRYDWVFIDPHPGRNILQKMLFLAVDYAIIPTRIDKSSIEAGGTTEDELYAIRNSRKYKNDCKAEVIGYVLNEYNRQATLAQIAYEELEAKIEEKANKPFLLSVSPAVRVSEVKTLGTSVSTTEAGSKTAREYYAIYKELVKRAEQE